VVEAEAQDFYKKVANRSKYAGSSPPRPLAICSLLIDTSQSQRGEEGEGERKGVDADQKEEEEGKN